MGSLKHIQHAGLNSHASWYALTRAALSMSSRRSSLSFSCCATSGSFANVELKAATFSWLSCCRSVIKSSTRAGTAGRRACGARGSRAHAGPAGTARELDTTLSTPSRGRSTAGPAHRLPPQSGQLCVACVLSCTRAHGLGAPPRPMLSPSSTPASRLWRPPRVSDASPTGCTCTDPECRPEYRPLEAPRERGCTDPECRRECATRSRQRLCWHAGVTCSSGGSSCPSSRPSPHPPRAVWHLSWAPWIAEHPVIRVPMSVAPT
eukprot:6140937-Prymnesium_polylepis.1